MKKIINPVVLFFLFLQVSCFASTLNIETDYRLRGLAYLNLDFNTGTPGDAVAYYNQRLRFSLNGKFPTSKSNSDIEIFTKFQSIGIVGSSQTVISSSITTTRFNWMNDLPYPNRVFQPFVENAYLKYTNVDGNPLDIIFGKQPLEYGSGFIVSDNDAGLNALRFIIKYPKNYNTEFFTAKIAENNRK